jgi:phenylalanine-4-hydroxylase
MNKIKNRKNNTVFKKFTKEDHSVWNALAKKRIKDLKGLVSPLHNEGWKVLNMNTKSIPDFSKVNKKLLSLTGWQVSSTGVQYENDDAWLSSLAEKKIRITEFIRPKNSLGYTPLPDIFHDAFGHLPFLVNPQYARIAHKFGLAYVKAKTKKNKLKIANNWWYGIEFSFIKENGILKAFGTGLVSSEGEHRNALSPQVKKLPYDSEVVGRIQRSAHAFHKKLFVLENLDQLENAVDAWL